MDDYNLFAAVSMGDFNEDDYTEEEMSEIAHRYDEQYDSTHMGDYEREARYLPQREE